MTRTVRQEIVGKPLILTRFQPGGSVVSHLFLQPFFNGLAQTGQKPLIRLAGLLSVATRLKPGVNEKQL